MSAEKPGVRIVRGLDSWSAAIESTSVRAAGTFSTEDRAKAAAAMGIDQIQRGVAPEGMHDLTEEGIQPRLPGSPEAAVAASSRAWIERQMVLPMRPKTRQHSADHGLFDCQRKLF